MWQQLGKLVLQYRVILLAILLAASGIMGYLAYKVKLSYEFSKAIPSDNPKYQDYLAFKQKFGDDGNLMVAGIQTDKLFTMPVFSAYKKLHQELKAIPNVEDVLSVPTAINLRKDVFTEKLVPEKIFPDSIASQAQLDSATNTFLSLPFYRGRLHNPAANAFLMGIRINKDSLNAAGRTSIINNITAATDKFSRQTGVEMHLSGLPLIRTVVADRIQKEMRFFLIGSLVLSVLILLLFFRSISTTMLSLLVVLLGVVWSLGILQLFGYKITLLTALIPPLVVVIGIPNCIYFVNKYHTSYLQSGDKKKALVDMVSKMGVVTLFCNITAAIGFAVFALTNSAILKEFGMVAGISIMMIFVISFILLPAALSYLPAPNSRQIKYLDNRFITSFLLQLERWVVNHKKWVYSIAGIILLVAIAGIVRLRTEAFIVDDLPKTDKIYTDLKFFEKNFKGVMPLEIVIDTKKRNGLAGARALAVLEKADSLSQYIAAQKEMSQPLGVAEGLKFARQAFYEGDTASYQFPNSSDMAFMGDYLRKPRGDSNQSNSFTKLLSTFMDSSRQCTRLSISMADVGTKQLPAIVERISRKANLVFNGIDSAAPKDTVKLVKNVYFDGTDSIATTDTVQLSKITITGTSITFLEGSRFIINGLGESIIYAFLLIAICMLYLFRSFRILFCSLIPNLVPLVITAGVMGWAGVPIKPSTVLVFSIALGIAIDITIRFLVNYRQELPLQSNDVAKTISVSINQTGLSIVYTSLVLVAGFVIFCFSGFGGTKALGWLTSVTLLVATLTNLVLLPMLLLLFAKKEGKKP
jgi:uncharacterized protein